MITSDDYLPLLPDQQAGARQDDYVFAFQRCLVGCPPDGSFLPSLPPAALVHHFRYLGGDLDADVAGLAAAAQDASGLSLYYAGVTIARTFSQLEGDLEVPFQSLPWFDASLIFGADTPQLAEGWLADPAYAAFRSDATEEVIVHVQPGL